MDAVYIDKGIEIVPSEFAAGPWDPTLQHGGAVVAQLAPAVEHDGERQTVRLSIACSRSVGATDCYYQ